MTLLSSVRGVAGQLIRRLTPSTCQANILCQVRTISPLTTPATLWSESEQRRSQSYDPYPAYETPSPYREKKKYRYGYRSKFYDGGTLPRPKGELEDIPLPMGPAFPKNRDQWTEKKALFGQNDYIDILGDGTIHPAQLITGPIWMRAFKGNEMQRLLRRFNFQGRLLKEFYPTRHHSMNKQIKYLYKKLNRRKTSNYFGSRGAANHSRLDKIKKHR